MLKSIIKEIAGLTKSLIQCGLAVNHNPPVERTGTVTWAQQKDLSTALKNVGYRELYRELNESKNYSIKMLDGALIQMLYKFYQKKVTSHVLTFYPSPSLERYQDNIDDYEEYYYGEGIYADILSKYIVSFPLRFDYSPDQHKDVEHPRVHLHLGRYEDCRIPVSAPLSPNLYIGFILRNFYSYAFRQYYDKYNFDTLKLTQTITDKEKRIVHINIPVVARQ